MGKTSDVLDPPEFADDRQDHDPQHIGDDGNGNGRKK